MDVRSSILQAGVTLLSVQGIAAVTQPKVTKTVGVKEGMKTLLLLLPAGS